MSEPLRTLSDPALANEAERDALIERLLLAGLDQYFEGNYEQAVNVWTRVAFLERGHGRARAYIERARGALAERQRHAEELLDRGIAAYDAGDLQAARDLLTRAVADGAANETAQVFLQRLGRLQPHGLGVAVPDADGGVSSGRPSRTDAPVLLRRSKQGSAPPATTNWMATVAVSVGLAAGIMFAAQPIASWLGERPLATPSIESRPDEPLPVLRASETRIARARSLHAGGRLHDALRILEEIDRADPLRAEADRVTADVQRDLLATAAPPASPAGETSR